MATYRLIHVVRDGSGDTTGLAEYTNSDTVLMPVHSSDPSGSTEGELIYNSTSVSYTHLTLPTTHYV